MKKIILSAAIALTAAAAAFAQETVKTLYDGEKVSVTWANTLTIPAEKFAEGVNVGDFISIALSNATDVLEIKGDGQWLPGSIFRRIDGMDEYRAYITVDMLAALKKYGMEICGASFDVTGVTVKNDGFNMPEGAIWGGFFWVDNWNTLELWRTAFDAYNGQRYLDINMEAKNNEYVLNVMTKFDDPAAVWASADNTVKTPSVATVDLKDIDVKAALADVNALLCQLNPERGEPFNVTSIVLRNDENDPSGIAETVAASEMVNVYNIQGMAVRTNVSAAAALENLPAGLYIVGGRKYAVK